MATLKQIKDKANAKLSVFWVELSAKQDAYFAKHGKYFGFNWTPSLSVVDGVDSNFGKLQRPSKNHIAEDISFDITSKLPFQIRVIRHHGGDGHGYTAWVRVKLTNGDVYMRSKGRGAHFTNNAWFKYEPITT
ncbi:MAG: hypothetical protein KAS32_22020 [Candidatus Peribacteraceae bacterium]|nr:hypothetical protein [Candidatus Peribacteraceae bacterium]